MPLTITFGVKNVPYSAKPSKPKLTKGKVPKTPRAMARGRRIPAPKTTGQVADILEERYHLIETFRDMFHEEIEEDIHAAYAEEIEGEDNLKIHQRLERKIERRFRSALDRRAFDGIIDGVPTKAALKGINHRLLHPYRTSNPSRPSFIDTGWYRKNFDVKVR